MKMIPILQLTALAMGLKELANAAECHKQRKTKWTIVSFCIGLFACGCAIISITGIL